MNKKILITVAVATMMASVASASPMTDYSQGKVAVDLSWRNTEISVENQSADKKYNMDWGITAGLGNNWAVQYRNFDPKTKDYSYVDGGIRITENGQLKTQEFNVLYKIDKNVAAYAGIMKAKGVIHESALGQSRSQSTNEANKWQLGLVGTTKLAEKTTAYALVGTGDELTTWEIGIGQEIAPNLEFNIDYREVKADKLEAGNNKINVKANGVGFGVTYKF